MRTADFIDRQAIAAHPHYTDSAPQADAAGMLEAFRNLGIRNLRTEAPSSMHQGQGTLHFLASNGIRFLFITGGDPAESLDRIAEFLHAHPGSVVLIEGINEPNNARVVYRGRAGLDAAQAFQADLHTLAKATPLLASIPVAGMASWPNLGGHSDVMNLHPYPTWARQPWKVLAKAVAMQQAVEDRSKGFAITEGGWHTLVGGSVDMFEGVDEQTQAKLLLNFVMAGVALGGRYVTIYTLYDEYADPARNNLLFHFGLFRFDGSPKPSAVALHNLNAILQDDGAQAEAFAPGSLRAKVTLDAHKLLLQNSRGEFFLVLWNEPDLWNDEADVPIDPVDEVTTVQFDCARAVAVFDPMVGTAPVRSMPQASQISVALNGHPLVLRLSGPGGCSARAN